MRFFYPQVRFFKKNKEKSLDKGKGVYQKSQNRVSLEIWTGANQFYGGFSPLSGLHETDKQKD